MKQAVKKVLENNMYHYDTMKAVDKATESIL